MEHISLLQLIATPERFDHKLVSVIGFVRLEFEGNALYLHEDDYKFGITKNGVWLSGVVQSKFSGRRAIPTDREYILVTGYFRAKQHGHMGLFSGTLEAESAMPWQRFQENLRKGK
jgi:hypothetical protein